MELGLAGKTVIVTGAGSNIGRGIALGFAREKCTVIVAEIDPKQGQAAADFFKKETGQNAVFIQTDVTKKESVQNMVKQAIEQTGRVDVLINNVGWTRDLFFLEKPENEWDREMALNLWSVIHCIKAVLPHMVEKKAGAIVNIASDAGRVGEPREAVYSGAKGGVIALGKALAKEYGRFKVRINTVCPAVAIPQSMAEIGDQSMWKENIGFMTPERQAQWVKLYPLGRFTTPEDVANACIFLCSDAASYITGQTLSVNGGFSML
ncbi:MAG: SDR family oxidoreductase [Chloroflexi bacterium]|nr:SDR family oxidoreductase [Chloroflexota bacterium]